MSASNPPFQDGSTRFWPPARVQQLILFGETSLHLGDTENIFARTANAGDEGSIPGLGRFLGEGEGEGNPLQYSLLANPMDRGAWWATVHGVTEESDTS